MKKRFSLLVPILTMFLIFGVFAPKRADAAEFSFEKEFVLEQEESVEDNLYIFSDSVDITGRVNGDLFIFAEKIKMDGYVTGNLYTFSNTVELGTKSRILGDLYTFGYNVNMDGEISGKATVFAYMQKHNGSTFKDLTSFTAQSLISGKVGDDLRVFAGKTAIDANIAGEAIVISEKYEIDEKKVGREIYDAKKIDEIAKSQGFDKSKQEKEPTQQEKFLKTFKNTVISSTALLLAGVFLIYLTPVKTGAIVKKITGSTTEFLKSFGLGIAIFLCAGIPVVMLFVTVVGMPIAMLLLAFMVFVGIFGRLWVELAIGSEILGLFKIKEYRPFKSLLIGRVLSSLISFIPVVSGIYSSVLVCTAMGAFVRMKADALKVQKEISKKAKVVKK
ncbi:TPA: hypothetical protein GX533_00985 [Candidatus Dojkabacteria bacterium]|jgi:hypothetical protein|uniref:DUF8173 domain-containing protein n=1 Tax=Candidatus Dojkabacteria bacterium TaxID=2099670 RepID=A0A832QC08_9BACT|nr:hypothetical protein [Candidatus Dojkabacteria bacterium]